MSSRRADSEEERPDQLNFEIGVQHYQSPENLIVRFRLTANHPQADYVADVATFYTLSEPAEIEPEVLVDFIERVAIMAAFPFIREAIATMASRLEVDVPLIGLLKAGQFQLHAEKPADTSTTQVTDL